MWYIVSVGNYWVKAALPIGLDLRKKCLKICFKGKLVNKIKLTLMPLQPWYQDTGTGDLAAD